jgi:hypothetical protein
MIGLVSPAVGVADELFPYTLSGSLGYNYRFLDSSAGQETTSHQALGSLHANSYIYRPWLATTDMSLTAALDDSETEGEGGATTFTGDSDIVTGVFNLNMLPQSRTPFNLRYSATDSRIDQTGFTGDTIVTLAGGDSKTRNLSLTQAVLFEQGHRIRGTYDNNRWQSERSGNYEEQQAGVQVDLRGKQQRATVNGKFREATRSTVSEKNESTLLDFSHYYYPSRALRIDTRASTHDIERGFDIPGNPQNGKSLSDIQQFSSFAFWRPQDSAWSLSGGFRVFDLSGENTGAGNETTSNDSSNMSASLGAFYQYNKRLRFDGSVSYSTVDSNNIDAEVNRQHLGVLYQSDMILLKDYVYSWYGNGQLDNLDDGTDTTQTYSLAGGHNIGRSWAAGESGRFRVNLSQTLTETLLTTEPKQDYQRLEHIGSFGWSQTAGQGTTFIQLTLSDSRNFGDNKSDQQMYNFQANRDQRISRRSSLSGNLTVQRVEQDFDDANLSTSVTTSTGRLNYRNIALFGVPRLGFSSNLLVSKASEEEGIDREEWENRLDYLIGRLSTSVTYRIIRHDELEYKLTYFRIERQF